MNSDLFETSFNSSIPKTLSDHHTKINKQHNEIAPDLPRANAFERGDLPYSNLAAVAGGEDELVVGAEDEGSDRFGVAFYG